MSALLARMRGERGQAIVFVVFGLAVMVAMASLVIDGGSWRRTQRQVQTAADAAALAGAQDIPNQVSARASALAYAQQNFSGIAAPTVTFPSAGEVDVVAAKPVSGLVVSALNATARAHARAAVGVPASLSHVAPVAVKTTAACTVADPSCYGVTRTVSFDESNIASSLIGLINVECHADTSSGCGSGSTGASVLGGWIENGYPSPLPANQWYGVKTGVSEGQIRAGLAAAAAARTTLLFPVWDQADAANRSFHVIGWAAFVIDVGGVNWTSHDRILTGHFTTFIATDVASGGTIDGAGDFGVHVINLTQ